MSLADTLQFYDTHATQFAKQTLDVDMQALYTPFIRALNVKAETSPYHHKQILDLGCGSGRDSMYFASLGYRVTAIDGSQKMIDLAKNSACTNSDYHQNIDWHCLRFNEIATQPWRHQFDGIWACASLLHVPYAELPDLLNELLTTLKPNGVMYASFKYGDSERVDNGRFFCDMDEDRWAKVKTKLTLHFQDIIWMTEDKRANRKDTWFNIIIQN